jgi:hypothetical protein
LIQNILAAEKLDVYMYAHTALNEVDLICFVTFS